MNRPPIETSATAPGPNPFLAAAAAAPPPPSPSLPPVTKTVPVTLPPVVPPFHQEFPFNGAVPAAPESPAPWTLPSMPLVSAPVEPVQTPVPQTVPLSLPPSPVAPVAPAAGPPPDFLKEVLSAIEEGRSALSGVFETLAAKLESAFATALSTAAPALSSVPPPGTVPAVEIPSIFNGAATAAPVSDRTARVSLPPVPPVMPVAPQESPAASRRRFARPAGVAAHQLNSTLHQVFVPPAAEPLPSGYASVGTAPVPPAPSVPPSRATAPVSPFQSVPPQGVLSPFAVSPAPLVSPEGGPSEPVPFTFLNSQSANYAPSPAPPPAPAPAASYDPLDDTVLPWMQPLNGNATRN